jgi:hypothetical protein
VVQANIEFGPLFYVLRGNQLEIADLVNADPHWDTKPDFIMIGSGSAVIYRSELSQSSWERQHRLCSLWLGILGEGGWHFIQQDKRVIE